jgi:hypothetical protein
VPSTFVVNTTADTIDVNLNDGRAQDAFGNTSLRAAVMQANHDLGADVITFAPQVHGTIPLDSTLGQLAITDELTISGPGAGKLAVSGNDKVRVFYISPGTTVAISRLAITHGHAETLETVLRSHGGGVLNDTDAHLTLTDVVLSDNTAQGILNVNDEPRHLGGGAGGGVANKGFLTVTGCTFIDNQALGVDSQNPIPGDPVLRFPGIALGGGLWNWMTGTATVTDSRFIDNLAQAGSHCTGTFAGLGQGGAIYNDNDLEVTGTLFSGNRAIGGDSTASPAWSGPAVGGAISSGTNERLIGLTESAVLNVSQCIFRDNLAHGGNECVAAVPQGVVPGSGTAAGGAIFVFQGEATVSQSVLDHNQAVGGVGAPDRVGGLALGGGICFVNFLDRPTAPGEAPGVKGTVEDCLLIQNKAIGGTGGDEARGGEGRGGGIAAGTFGLNALFGEVNLSNTVVAGNLVQGGDGGLGGAGGNGLGGGVYNDSNETMTVTRSLIVANRARGGEGQGGSDGLGIGGGVYNVKLGNNFLTTDTVILGNTADEDSNLHDS